MLVIMGTSLKVHGFKALVKGFARAVHETASSGASGAVLAGISAERASARNHAGKVIFVNKTPPGAEWDGIVDYWVEGESDTWVEKVLDDWRKMVPGDWAVKNTLEATIPSAGAVNLMVPKDVNCLDREQGTEKLQVSILSNDPCFTHSTLPSHLFSCRSSRPMPVWSASSIISATVCPAALVLNSAFSAETYASAAMDLVSVALFTHNLYQPLNNNATSRAPRCFLPRGEGDTSTVHDHYRPLCNTPLLSTVRKY